jgi:Protein of unknown function (DUF1501)
MTSTRPPSTTALTRRTLLRRSGTGLGAVALASLLSRRGVAADGVRRFVPRAKRVIYLYMAGGPSHLELFDFKPRLGQLDGTPMPESFTRGQPIAQLQGRALRCFGPQYAFERFGKSGQQLSSLLPQIGSIADDICIVRSMTTDQINHDPAHTVMNTGTSISGRPSMGSWLWYGLGSEADDLPGFVVMTSSGKGGQMQPIAARQWASGFLPSRFQGVQFRSTGDGMPYLSSPPGVSPRRQREVIDAIRAIGTSQPDWVDDPEVATRLTQYEMAFKLQTSVPAVSDISREPKRVLERYGVQALDGSFAANCLLARRLAERGVRFIQLYHRDWDHHGRLKEDIAPKAREVDRASAALITDLKERGMLNDTLIIWGGEFGRTPMAQGDGRDHHIKGFSIWLAGGGVKGGISHGATDELGYNAVQDPVSVHDLHATVLYLLGIDHERLTFKFQGRDFRLTDVSGVPVKPILA